VYRLIGQLAASTIGIAQVREPGTLALVVLALVAGAGLRRRGSPRRHGLAIARPDACQSPEFKPGTTPCCLKLPPAFCTDTLPSYSVGIHSSKP
jgi:hypothetical protein